MLSSECWTGIVQQCGKGRRQRVNIHEYQAAELLAEYGIPVNAGEVVTTADAAAAALERLVGPQGTVAIKAQVHTGGRGKAGGIKLASSPDDARDKAGQILGMDIRGHVVQKVYVVPAVEIEREYYLGIILDRSASGITLMASAEGGVDIEEVARETPEKIIRMTADRQMGLLDYQARQVAFDLGIEPDLVNGFAKIAKQLYAAFVGVDASLAEINPLILTKDRQWMALDSKVTIDDNALPRHPGFEDLRDMAEENETELRAKAHGISFVKLDGNIGCVVNGAGLAMATMDAVKLYGGEPANFLDVGGGASAEQVAMALQMILEDENVKAILFNIFGGITRGDLVAQGIVEAMNTVGVNVPMVIRLVGTNQDEGRKILADAGLSSYETMSEAAQQAVAVAQ
ncbi:MAG: ADP-forming succinate--CoA ligase subunit beta [Thermomicrobiales bacterium]|nr:ADP-forming succinate--CoA ligase subunit beta [Thermomicrobiales bacterium]